MKEESRRLVAEEMIRARRKFPRPELLMTALTEEVGELAQALLQYGNGPQSREEAVQVASTAIRILEEGDPVYDNLDEESRQP